MKQILQDLKTGETRIVEVPDPQCPPNHVLIRTRCSVISPGTERMLVEFGKGNLITKVRSQPEKVRQVFDKIKTDGLATTVEAVTSKLAEPLPLGYCNAGVVIETGDAETAALFPEGSRVVSNGHHAGVVSIGRNLVAKIPENVTDEEAAFAPLGAIALQGIRLADPTLGETFLVIGLGVVGLLSVQLLKANGCRVIALEKKEERLKLGADFGAEVIDPDVDPIEALRRLTGGDGVDGVLMTLSSTSSEPVHQAAQACRKRGRIVLVGVTGLDLNRNDFFKREIRFQVSSSYGPGRYDPNFEERGNDYPRGFVRWTAQRNFEAVLRLLSTGELDIRPLINGRFKLEEAPKAYDQLTGSDALGLLIQYGEESHEEPAPRRVIQLKPPRRSPVTIGVIGSGNFARRVLLPHFERSGATIGAIVSQHGVSAAVAAEKFGASASATDPSAAITADSITTTVITTRHDTHAKYVCDALNNGKHVYVEKPLALTMDELREIDATFCRANSEAQSGLLMHVGYNRRFSPHLNRIKNFLTAAPKCMVYTVNAGSVPADSWVLDPLAGGGRVIGEVCHFIDTVRFLADSPIDSLSATSSPAGADQNLMVTLKFADESLATINYLVNGAKSLSKERLQIFSAGRAIDLQNFRLTEFHEGTRVRKYRSLRQDKGHGAQVAAFCQSHQRAKGQLIPYEDLLEVSLATFAAVESARTNTSQRLDEWWEQLREKAD